MEVGFIILHDGLVDDGLFQHRWLAGSLIYLEDKVLQEVFLLSEVLLILHLGYLERIHGDRLFLGVGNVGSPEVAADSLIAVTGIYNHNICVLLIILSHHRVHEEALSASGGSQYEEIGVVGILHLSFLTGGIYRHRYTLAVCIVAFQGRLVSLGLMLLIHQTQSCL